MKTSLIHSFCLAFFLLLGHLTHGQIIQKLTHRPIIQELTHEQFLLKAFFHQGIVFPEIDTLPSYPGGDKALENYIYTNLKEASKKMDQSLLTLSTYRASVLFQLDETGNVNKERVKIHESTPDMTLLDEKVKEMIKNMPAWSPCIIGNTATPQTIGLKINYNAKMSQIDFK